MFDTLLASYKYQLLPYHGWTLNKNKVNVENALYYKKIDTSLLTERLEQHVDGMINHLDNEVLPELQETQE